MRAAPGSAMQVPRQLHQRKQRLHHRPAAHPIRHHKQGSKSDPGRDPTRPLGSPVQRSPSHPAPGSSHICGAPSRAGPQMLWRQPIPSGGCCVLRRRPVKGRRRATLHRGPRPLPWLRCAASHRGGSVSGPRTGGRPATGLLPFRAALPGTARPVNHPHWRSAAYTGHLVKHRSTPKAAWTHPWLPVVAPKPGTLRQRKHKPRAQRP
mmetsp:Transcript_51146/g.95835  ORF Transcript_51146/g.95835 Transcript_51146/m.95835 type:complete len:207 (-) Transcript_51146:696-1316(-)